MNIHVSFFVVKTSTILDFLPKHNLPKYMTYNVIYVLITLTAHYQEISYHLANPNHNPVKKAFRSKTIILEANKIKYKIFKSKYKLDTDNNNNSLTF